MRLTRRAFTAALTGLTVPPPSGPTGRSPPASPIPATFRRRSGGSSR